VLTHEQFAILHPAPKISRPSTRRKPTPHMICDKSRGISNRLEVVISRIWHSLRDMFEWRPVPIGNKPIMQGEIVRQVPSSVMCEV